MKSLAPLPAKIVLERRVEPGDELAFTTWVHQVIDLARATGALEGSSVFALDTERFLLLRFHTEDDLAAWRARADEDGLLPVTNDRTHPHIVRTGLETWFTLPGHPLPHVPPPRWKMALLTWLALMPTVVAMAHVVPRIVPRAIVLPISTALTVSALTWLLMPSLARVLQHWLYPSR